MPTRDFLVNKDAFVVDSGGDGAGAGGGWTINIGEYSGTLYRGLARFNLDFSGMTVIQKAELRMKTANEVGWTYASPRAKTKRITKNWKEGSHGTEGTGGISYSSGNAVVWGNQPDTSSHVSPAKDLSGATNKWVTLDVTNHVMAWAPERLSGGNNSNYGLKIMTDHEGGSPSERLEVWSSESRKGSMHIRVTYLDTTSPLAPVELTPGGADNPTAPSVTGTTATLTGRFVDPDSGDTLGAVNWQRCDLASTDEIPVVQDEGTVTRESPGTAVLTDVGYAIPITGLTIATQYRHRERTQDQKGRWGPFSTLDDDTGLFRAVAKQSAPGGLSVDKDTLSPYMYARLISPDDAARIASADIEVFLEPTGSAPVPKWADGPFAVGGLPLRYQVTYGGDQLSFGLRYRWRTRIQDQYGQWSPWSAPWIYWTPVEPVGPTNLVPRNNELVTQTPSLQVTTASAFDAWQIEIGETEDGGEIAYTAAATKTSSTTHTHVVASGFLGRGVPYWWRFRVRTTGQTEYGSYSDWMPFRTDHAPARAVNVQPGSRSSTTPMPTSKNKPLYTAVYNDSDLISDNDRPSSRTVEIRRRSDDVIVETNTLASPPYQIPMRYQGAVTLTAETVYYQRWHWTDQLGLLSGWSERLYFKYSRPPDLTITPLIDPLYDPTPLVTWSATFYGGRHAVAYRVEVLQDGSWVRDTGVVYSTATSYRIPPEALETGLLTQINVTVIDDDGNAVTASITTHTFFSVPSAPAYLTAYDNVEDGSIDLLWSGVAAGIVDAFDREVTQGWSKPTIGPVWDASSGVLTRVLNDHGEFGPLTVGSAAYVHSQPGGVDVEVLFEFSADPPGPAPVPSYLDVVVRSDLDGTDGHRFRITIDGSTGNLSIQINPMVANVAQPGGSPAPIVTGLNVGANKKVKMRLQVTGQSAGTIAKARWWYSTVGEPVPWNLTHTVAVGLWPVSSGGCVIRLTRQVAQTGAAILARIWSVQYVNLLDADADIYAWYVRRQFLSGPRELIGVVTELVTPSFRDFGAPLGVTCVYTVDAYNGWTESEEAAEAEATLLSNIPGSSYIVTEGQAIELWQATDLPFAFSPVQEAIQPIGRAEPIVESLAMGAISGTAVLRIPPDERRKVITIRDLARRGEAIPVWLKTPYGYTARVALGNVRAVPGPDGVIELAVDWVRVGP